MRTQAPRIRVAVSLCAIAAVGAGAPAVASAATPAFSPVAGSPFTTLGSPSSAPTGVGGDGPISVAFSPDGSLLATGNEDGTVSDFSVASGGSLTQLPGAVSAPFAPGVAAAWNPAGTELIVGNEDIDQSELQTFKPTVDNQLTAGRTFYAGKGLTDLAFSPNGNYLAASVTGAGPSGDSGAVEIYTVGSGGALTEIAEPMVPAYPTSVAFSPNGNDLAIAEQGSDTVTVLKVSTFTPVAGSPFTVAGAPEAVAYRPNGRALAVGLSDGVVSLQSVSSAGALASAASAALSGPAQAVTWSPDGSLLAVSADADSVFQIHGGDTLTPVAGSPFTVGNSPDQLVFGANGTLLATADEGDSTVTVLSAAAPVCRSSTATTGGGPVRVQLHCTSVSGEQLGYAITSPPADGSLGPIDQSDGQVTYTPSGGSTGADSFSFQATSGGVTSAPASVVVLGG